MNKQRSNSIESVESFTLSVGSVSTSSDSLNELLKKEEQKEDDKKHIIPQINNFFLDNKRKREHIRTVSRSPQIEDALKIVNKSIIINEFKK